MKPSSFVALLAVVLSQSARAQTVPLLTLEGVVGAGGHNVIVGDQSVVTGNAVVAPRAGVSVRLGPATRIAAYAKADFTPTIEQKVELKQCTPACIGDFSLRSMRAAGIGLRIAATPRLLIGGLVGAGYVGKTGSRHTTHYAETDLTVRLWHHVGVIGAWRYTRWRQNDLSFWYAPISGGIQIF